METFNKILLEIQQYPWLWYLVRILGFFLIAWVVHRLSRHFVRPLTAVFGFKPGNSMKPERRQTLDSLIASGISGLAFLAAGLFSVGLFVDTATLVWMVGLFSAAFGLGARPLISDVLTGVGFIFEDTFAVGDKVEVVGIEGVIEAIDLRTTLLRSPTGELTVIPNGEIRTLRNFSRGRFSTTKVHLKVAASELNRALSLLESLGEEAVMLLPNLLEPWQVLSEGGSIGQQTELTLVAKARFGQAAEMRPRLLALLHERFEEEKIPLMD